MTSFQIAMSLIAIAIALLVLALLLYLIRAYARNARPPDYLQRPICPVCYDARMVYTAQHQILRCPRCGVTLNQQTGGLTPGIPVTYNLPE